MHSSAVYLSTKVASNLQPTTPAGVTVILLPMVLLLSIYMSKLVKALECAHYINLALLEFINLILELSGSDDFMKAIVLCVSIGLSLCLLLVFRLLNLLS